MSTTKRLFSGAAASWARIFVTLISQLALVPIFLSYWDVNIFGIWIAIQALVNVLSTFDRGFNDFMEYEFLKIGEQNRELLSSLLWSSIYVILVISLVELLIIYVFAFNFNISYFFGESKLNKNMINQVSWALIIHWIVWLLTNIIGLFFRALSAFGYFPRIGWWNVLLAIVSSLASIISVIYGAGLLWASIWTLISSFIILTFQYFDVMKLLKKEQLVMVQIVPMAGFNNYLTSFGLSSRYFLENIRQQGVRLILAPLTGVAGLTLFSTTRTIANVAQQGLVSITHPLLPELMRFLRQKDQVKMEASFGTVWLVLIAFLSPLTVLLQIVAPMFFLIWTKGQISFNPSLFAILSISVLVFAMAQPAMAIVVGNNLLRKQMIVSFVSSILVVITMFLLIPIIGIAGSGIALLLAEIIAAFGFIYYSKKWLLDNDLLWPKKAFYFAFRAVWLASIGLFLIVVFPEYKWLIFVINLGFLSWNLLVYWQSLPEIFVQKVVSMINKIPFVRKIISYNLKS